AQLDAKVAEQIKVQASLFQRTQITQNITVQVPPELLQQLGTADVKALPATEVVTEPVESTFAGPPGLALVMPPRLSIVKASEFTGTRVHVEFALLNDTDHLVAIRH